MESHYTTNHHGVLVGPDAGELFIALSREPDGIHGWLQRGDRTGNRVRNEAIVKPDGTIETPDGFPLGTWDGCAFADLGLHPID